MPTAAQKRAAREAATNTAAGQTPTPPQQQVPQTPANVVDVAAAANAAFAALSGAPPKHFTEQFEGLEEKHTMTAAERAARADRIASLQEEILLQELETKRITLEMTQDQNQQYKQTKEQRLRSAANAQKILNQADWNRKQVEEGCMHATGGFGLDEIYEGDNKPSVVAMDMPIPGRRAILCYRCLKMVITPDPNLRYTDADKWLEETADYKEFMKLLRKSLSKPMAGPNFNFEEDGKPVHPEMA